MNDDFETFINRFSRDVVAHNNDVWLGVGEELLRAVVEGSEITGSPGQQVGQYGPGYNPGKVGGNLKASWQRWFPSATEQAIATDAPYAEQEEDGISYHGTPIRQRTTVGGPHSRKLAILGYDNIVGAALKRLGDR